MKSKEVPTSNAFLIRSLVALAVLINVVTLVAIAAGVDRDRAWLVASATYMVIPTIASFFLQPFIVYAVMQLSLGASIFYHWTYEDTDNGNVDVNLALMAFLVGYLIMISNLYRFGWAYPSGVVIPGVLASIAYVFYMSGGSMNCGTISPDECRPESYWWKHTLWHAFMSLASTFLMFACFWDYRVVFTMTARQIWHINPNLIDRYFARVTIEDELAACRIIQTRYNPGSASARANRDRSSAQSRATPTDDWANPFPVYTGMNDV